ERPEDGDKVAAAERGQRPRPGSDRVDEERELPRRRKAEAHRARKQPPRSLEHEELPRSPGIEPAALHPDERVRTHRLDTDDANRFRSVHRFSPAETG